MATPAFLIAEMRFAFKTCNRSHSLTCRSISSTRQLSRKPSSAVGPRNEQPSPQKPRPNRQWPYNGALTTEKSSHVKDAESSSSSTELVSKSDANTALDSGRKVPVPMRAIPKAELSPNIRLSPRERLHIEVLTRQMPKPKEKPIYRERLQVYHIGGRREVAMILGKQIAVWNAALMTAVLAPAIATAGWGALTVSAVWIVGLCAPFALHWVYGPKVSRVFLKLPSKARETPEAAMEFARNLPRDVALELEYLQPWAIVKRIHVKLSDIEPVQSTGWFGRGINFKLKGVAANEKPTFCPSGFSVLPETAFGSASKNTIPGIWGAVFKRLMSTPEDLSRVRWDKIARAEKLQARSFNNGSP